MGYGNGIDGFNGWGIYSLKWWVAVSFGNMLQKNAGLQGSQIGLVVKQQMDKAVGGDEAKFPRPIPDLEKNRLILYILIFLPWLQDKI